MHRRFLRIRRMRLHTWWQQPPQSQEPCADGCIDLHRSPLQGAQLERRCILTAHICTPWRGPRVTSQRTPMPGYPYQSSASPFFLGGRTQTHPTQANNSGVPAAASLPGRAYLQETLLQQVAPQAPPHLHRASPTPLLPNTKPAAEASPHPKYRSLHPPDKPQMWGSLVSTSELLQRGPEPHPAPAALLREGDVGVSGGIGCIYLVPQTLSHLGQPLAGRTVANHQLYVQGGVNPGCAEKQMLSKNEVAELQGGTGRWL